VAGYPELADNEYVQRSVQGSGDLKGDGNAASRQGEYNYISSIGVFTQFFGKQSARFSSVSKKVSSFVQGLTH
jgi:hypothetical protein